MANMKLNIPLGGIAKAAIPVLGKAEKTAKEGVYAVKTPAIIGKQYFVLCPVCGKPILVKAVEPKVFRVMHKTCNAPIILKGVGENENFSKDGGEDNDEPTEKVPEMGKKTNAKLSWWSLAGRKQFVLSIGKNYVGRKDVKNPSDLSLKDEYASAKSICIDVNKSVRGYSFHLTVERATNPVFINGKEHPVGSSFDLNYGDIIKLGNTTLTFNSVKRWK